MGKLIDDSELIQLERDMQRALVRKIEIEKQLDFWRDLAFRENEEIERIAARIEDIHASRMEK